MCMRCPPVGHIDLLLRNPHQPVDFADVGDVRRLLGPEYAELSDTEVEQLRDLLLGFSEAAFNWWLRRRARKVAESNGRADNSE